MTIVVRDAYDAEALEHTRAYSGKPHCSAAGRGKNMVWKATWKAKWVAITILLCVGVLGLSGCRHTPDEEQVRKAIAATAEGAEAGKAGDTVAALTEDFDGNAGQLDRKSLANLIRLYALRGQKVHVLMGPMDVQRRGERMVATFTVTLTAGVGVLPDNAGAYEVETGWRKEDGEWRCFTASWKKAL